MCLTFAWSDETRRFTMKFQSTSGNLSSVHPITLATAGRELNHDHFVALVQTLERKGCDLTEMMNSKPADLPCTTFLYNYLYTRVKNEDCFRNLSYLFDHYEIGFNGSLIGLIKEEGFINLLLTHPKSRETH